MRKTESKNCPKVITLLRHKRIAFNLEEVSRQTEEGVSEIFYRYDEVIVSRSATRDEMISAIIRTRYSLDEELALVNNINKQLPTTEDEAEYAEFQQFREFAKQLADVVILKPEDLPGKTVAQLDDIAQIIDIAARTDGYYELLKNDKVEMLTDILGI
jgi:hypothetical protein